MSIKAGYCPRISRYELYIQGDEDILRDQVVRIKTHDSFSAGDVPIPNGLYDRRMGAIAHSTECATCLYDEKKCPGHFGYFKLGGVNKDFYLVQPIAIDDISKWCKIICLKCGSLLIDVNKIKTISKSKRLQTAAQLQLSGSRQCKVCNTIHPKIRNNEDSPFSINIESNTGEKRTLEPLEIKQIFDKISDETCIILGRSLKSHPRKYFIQNLSIPPIPTRPYIKNTNSGRGQRTPAVVDFIKNIIRKINALENSSQNRASMEYFLRSAFNDMIRAGTLKKGENRTTNVIGGPLQDALLKQLGGKKGVIRNFQMAHRALSSSRNTISGNPYLKINEVGIPKIVSKTLLVIEVVRQWNIDALQADINNDRCPRIKVYSTGKEHAIHETNKNDIELHWGDIVYRNIKRGDQCIFNRPPSLKESSIGSHEAYPFPKEDEETFQINVCVCPYYNADFDGDQMRIKVLRTAQAKAESLFLSSVSKSLLSSQNSTAVTGQIQDSVIGSALMTKSNVKIDRFHTMRLWSATRLPLISIKKKLYTGREVASLLFSKTPISYRGKAKYYNELFKDIIDYKDDEINVVIKNGEVISGILDKSTVGDGVQGGLYHLIALEHGVKASLESIYTYQQMVLKYLQYSGFTMGMDDLVIPKETRKVINEIISDQIVKSNLLSDELSKGELYAPMGTKLNDYYEKLQRSKLANDQRVFNPIISSFDKDNNGLFNMVIHGGKGKPQNIMSIHGYVGQVMIEGERMPNTLSYGRSSIYYPRYALFPKSKGFIEDSLSEGIDSNVMAYAAAEARQQIVQKSQSTAISGSNQRRHIKNMEGTISNYHRGVYKSYMLLQYLYGENGFDPRYLLKIKIDSLTMTMEEINTNYYYKSSDKKLQHIFDNEIQKIRNNYTDYHKMANNLVSIGLVNSFPNKLSFGIYLDSALDSITKQNIKVSDKELSEMTLIVDDYITNTLPYLYLNNIQRKNKGYIPSILKNACFVVEVLFRIKFNSKTFLVNTNKNLLLLTLDKISIKFVSNLIPPGSCVGVQSAQSVGEPMTQMMLDAVHGGSSGAAAGLEKSKEILSAKYPSKETNSMWFRLTDKVSNDKVKVSNIAELLRSVKLKDFISSYDIFLEKYGNPIHPRFKHEKEMIINFEKRNPSLKKFINKLSSWVIRLSLNKKSMMYKSVTVEKIVQKLYDNFSNLIVIYSTELDKNIIFRIYIKEVEFLKVSDKQKYVTEKLLGKIKNTLLRGINDIMDTKVQPITVKKESEDGSFVTHHEYMIRTVGVDVENLLQYSEKFSIDTNEIHIGSVMDTFDYYGIEAARSRTIEQLEVVMEGKSPSYHHLTIYADILTFSGKVKAIERAIRHENDKTFGMASGHSASRILMNAAILGVNESTDSITAPIMIGSIPRIGTFYHNVLINKKFIKENTKSSIDTIKALL